MAPHGFVNAKRYLYSPIAPMYRDRNLFFCARKHLLKIPEKLSKLSLHSKNGGFKNLKITIEWKKKMIFQNLHS